MKFADNSDNSIPAYSVEQDSIFEKSKTFDAITKDWIKQNHFAGSFGQSILCPTNPYAASKAAAESIVQSYIKSFKMPIIITRGNNVYGPNQYPEKVIPKFIQQLRNGEKITIQGDGTCVRGFLHVNDTADAFIKILEKGKIGEIYNIGCDEDMEISILDLAKKIHNLSKIKVSLEDSIEYIEDRPFNDKRYYISNEKLKQMGWQITTNLDEGLKNLLINK